jgi:lysophospholipase L1-like esterase
MMGINDLLNGQNVSHVETNYEKVINKIRSESPDTVIYIQSILPINNDIVETSNVDSQEIITINEKLKTYADGNKIFFIDIYSSFCGADNKMFRTYAWDGLHPSAYGYLVWKNLISPYVK